MRYSGDWMVLADDRILEFVRENESGRPTAMSESGSVRYSRQYVHQRCKKLVEHGLLKHLGNGVYVITERGERYLDGEIDTSEDAPDEVDTDTKSDGPGEAGSGQV